MDNWSGQVIYAVLAITVGGALCGMEKSISSPQVTMNQPRSSEESEKRIPAEAVPRIVLTAPAPHLANSYASF